MKLKRVMRIPYTGNSERNLVLRQQFAVRMLGLLGQGKRILNVDETWINETSFQRRKWREHGSTNSVVGHQMNPRILMITALDTKGEVYVSLT